MSKFLSYLALALVLAIFSGCAGVRKARAGKILQNCKFSLSDWSLKSVELDSGLFPKAKGALESPFPNSHILGLAKDLLQGTTRGNIGMAWIQADLLVESAGDDSLWVESFKGTLKLDTLIDASWKASKPAVLGKGHNRIPLLIQLPMDARLFKIMTADSLELNGGMIARLDPQGTQIPLNFQQKRENPREEIQKFLDNAKQDILDALLNGWAKSIRTLPALSP